MDEGEENGLIASRNLYGISLEPGVYSSLRTLENISFSSGQNHVRVKALPKVNWMGQEIMVKYFLPDGQEIDQVKVTK